MRRHGRCFAQEGKYSKSRNVFSPDEFYLPDPPTHLQQGDICADVATILPPHDEELLLVRERSTRRRLDRPVAGPVELVRERALGDAFDDSQENIAAVADRVWAMLMTPTCDLEGLEVWAVWPLHTVEGSREDVIRALATPSHPTLFRLPENGRFPASYIDLTDFRSIVREHFQLKDRIASVTREAQHALTERFLMAQGRPWGYAPGETVQPLGRHETGAYRCARCTLYSVSVPEIMLKPGEMFPDCENCKKINKSAQWYPIRKHKKS